MVYFHLDSPRSSSREKDLSANSFLGEVMDTPVRKRWKTIQEKNAAHKRRAIKPTTIVDNRNLIL